MVKILVADDDRGIVKLVSNRLESHGYDVIRAFDGVTALEKVKDERPDLIILDIVMPEPNGSTVCGVLKFDERYKDIPIIILSAKNRTIDKEIGRKVKADAYLTKPFDPDELMRTVKEFAKI